MADLVREILPLPYGQRALVVADLDLSPATDVTSRPVREFVRLLDDQDDAVTVVVAGNLFAGPAGREPEEFVAATLSHLATLAQSIERFTASPHRRLVVLPGSHDREILTDGPARASLETRGVELAEEVVLRVATAETTRDVRVAVGGVAGEDELTGEAARLEDPTSSRRFAASRLFYRRLSRVVWLPLWAVLVVDFAGALVELIDRLTHHSWHLHHTHPSDVWSAVVIDIVTVAAFEALLAVAVTLVARRRFARATGAAAPSPAEPLHLTRVDGDDALAVAVAVAASDGVGAVIGGSPRPALAFLDRGMCAAPGPSREVVVERRNRLGLPPVFTPVSRFGLVVVEASTTVRVRLVGGQDDLPAPTRLERWLGGAPRQPAPGATTAPLGSCPDGNPWPPPSETWTHLRRQRTVRRLTAVLLVLAGLTDIVAGVVPPVRERLHAVLGYLPIGLVQSATAATVLAGVALVMVARGVRRGQRRSWTIAVLVLAGTVVTHLARGGSVRAALIAIVILVILVLGRESFAATSETSGISVTLPRTLAVAALAVIAATLGVEFTNLHHGPLPGWPTVMAACAERLVGVTSISLPDRVADFVDPAMLTLGAALILVALYAITRPVVDRRLSDGHTTTERRLADLRARDIVRRHGRGTLDYFALRDDKQFFFFRDSLVAYAVYGGVALISPDPIGPGAERAEVFSAFRQYADSHGWTIGVMGAGEEWLALYHRNGLHTIYLGDEAIVDCQSFSLSGGKMKGLRQACTRLARHGYTVTFLDPATVDPVEVPAIMELISMLRRGDAERGFSMMLGRLFDPRDQGLLLTLVKDPSGHPAAVCQFVPAARQRTYSLDLMRRDPGEHPNGLLDFALCSTISYLAENGVERLSMNFAAFRSVLEGEKGEGTLTRVERWGLRRLSGVLPIESLWSFNAKYEPNWLPRYLAYPAAESFVPVVAAILRAESLTEIPVIGRFLANDPSNRPGTVVPEEVLAAARHGHPHSPH